MFVAPHIPEFIIQHEVVSFSATTLSTISINHYLSAQFQKNKKPWAHHM